MSSTVDGGLTGRASCAACTRKITIRMKQGHLF
jgi:hypothetical protein